MAVMMRWHVNDLMMGVPLKWLNDSNIIVYIHEWMHQVQECLENTYFTNKNTGALDIFYMHLLHLYISMGKGTCHSNDVCYCVAECSWVHVIKVVLSEWGAEMTTILSYPTKYPPPMSLTVQNMTWMGCLGGGAVGLWQEYIISNRRGEPEGGRGSKSIWLDVLSDIYLAISQRHGGWWVVKSLQRNTPPPSHPEGPQPCFFYFPSPLGTQDT